MNDQAQAAEADRELKKKHRAMWASGDYPALADEMLLELGAVLVEACGINSRQRVLDVAAGSGNAAIPAAMMGAKVVAADLTPELFEAGRREAANRGVSLEWQEADAEALPFGDDEFDTVMSCLGAMFAPHHQAAADELVRVCKPGGTIGLLSWTPEGFIGRMFATMKPFAPPPPPGAQPAPLWGSEDHVRELMGDRITDVHARKQTLAVRSFHRPEDFVRYFKSHYGPIISVYKFIAEDGDKVKALDQALTELAESFGDAHGDTPFQMEWEYLLLTAKKAK
ncbi:class I SAM-dependent methyltransferase [Pseudarthrobacter phenanthrenivorans]|jgi:ubiquinone/menaquinone biosynthesis C-methylase UbiE|uniref:Class I SAM-dependent methyltransferase n=2 Tax=Pseudarthrobacter phenanthrenivorans TaxID=361575 RepID=A0A3B0FLQ5_PSEPS|nr:class I SAM-dependent methyltransferase [Pseudarthrobacter phenanthrenivorans]ADX71642.1 methylase involved in ubiquinone/menaquinone biosynthesis [Pseudarthrobacter phenanthrenivorans Sphe3]RKO20830.1 class I SAM-dependent methyltransferase [Pseudarthrobacter phenanthrenivorans]TPV48844.1 class I SAM-dependent methyltransferase [Pseudarthrobacter phenanthrenivorans]